MTVEAKPETPESRAAGFDTSDDYDELLYTERYGGANMSPMMEDYSYPSEMLDPVQPSEISKLARLALALAADLKSGG